MKYERLTSTYTTGDGEKTSDYINPRTYAVHASETIFRLAELEDKIERGELISTVQSEQGDQEIAFFVAHNATVRKQAVEKFASSLKAEFYGDWQRGNISERTYNFIIGEILFVLSIEGYGE